MNDDPAHTAPESLAELASIPEKATASACFGDPSSVGDHLVVPVAEVTYGLGASPSGVEVHAIRDETAITLASIAFASAATAIVARTLNKLIRG